MSWLSLMSELKPILELATSIAGLLAAVLLGIMAVLLSRAANRIAESQLKLAERQTVVAEHQLQPRFRFVEEEMPETQGRLLRLYNDGAPIEWFSLDQISFLALEQGGPPTAERHLIPTYYYGDREYTGSMVGLLATLSPTWLMIDGQPNYSAEDLQELENELKAWRSDLTVILRPFIMIHYSDSLGRDQHIAYEIRPQYGSFFGPSIPRRLADDRARVARRLFGPVSPQPLKMLTATDIVANWESYPNAEKLDGSNVADGV